ncbi:MAG: hypothetical protein AAGF94_08535 [Pseudomonadota bacterium]
MDDPNYVERVSVDYDFGWYGSSAEDGNGPRPPYRLDQSIAPDDPLVQMRRPNLIASINLEDLVNGLSLLTDLVDLAYNAMPRREGKLRGVLGQLQIDYADLCLRCSTGMNTVRSSSDTIGKTINSALGKLYEGDWERALKLLALSGRTAGKLADVMRALAEEFESLATIADEALQSTEELSGDEEKAKEALLQTQAEWEAKKARASKLQEELTTLIGELDVKYKAAEKDLEKTEDRAFALALTGAIMKPLGEAIGGAATAVALIYSGPPSGNVAAAASAANALSSSSAPASAPPPSSEPDVIVPKEKQDELDAARAELTKSKVGEELLQNDKDQLEIELELVKKALAAPDADSAGKAAYTARKTEIDATLEALEQAGTKLKSDSGTAQTRFDAAKSAVEALGVSVASAGQEFSNMGHDYLELAEGKRDQLQKLFELIMEKKDLEREELAVVAEATTRLANISTNIESSVITLRSLALVISALRKAASILHEAAAFWQLMKEGCDKLADSDALAMMDIYAPSEGASIEEVLDAFDDDALKQALMDYKADWTALGSVAGEYAALTSDIYQDAKAKRETSLDIEEAQSHVATLAAQILQDVADEQSEIEAEQTRMTEAMGVSEAA